MPTRSAITQTVTVRVRRRLLSQGALAVCALVLPLLIALYWLTIPAGTWPWVAAAQGVVMVTVALAVIQYFRVSITATPTELIEHGFFGLTTHAPIERIGRAVLLEMHRSASAESQLQMFVLGHNGEVLLRMRGEYWSRSSINRIAAQLVTVPIEHVEHPVTLDEMQRTNPRMLYWFERRPQRSH